MYLSQLARDCNVNESQLERAVQNGGIPCESTFNGIYVDSLAELPIDSLNLVYLHANLFGTFPVVSLPCVNMLALWPEMTQLNNEKGLVALISRAFREVPVIADPRISHEDLFSVVQFLSCIWADIRVFSYRYQEQLYWNPLVSFDSPMYYRPGTIPVWKADCNILRAEILEIINSIYRLLLCSYGYYRRCFKYVNKPKPLRRRIPISDFSLLNATDADMYTYDGIKCLSSTSSRETACKMLTTVRRIIAKFICMLLRIPQTQIQITTTTWNTLASDVKHLYKMVQKAECYLNN